MRMRVYDNLAIRLAGVVGGVVAAMFVVVIMAMTARVCLAGGSASGRCQVRIRRCVQVKAGPVCLGDVADVTGSDKDFRIQLENMIIAWLKGGQKVLSVGRLDINRALSMAHIAPASIDIYGSVSCKVSVKKAEVKVGKVTTTGLGSIASISSISGVSGMGRMGGAGGIRGDYSGISDARGTRGIRGGDFVANAGQRVGRGQFLRGRGLGVKRAIGGGVGGKFGGKVLTLRERLFDSIAEALGLDSKRLSIRWRCNKAGFLDSDATDAKRFSIRRCGPVTLGAVRFEIRDNTRPGKVKDGFGIERKVPSVMVSATVEYLCASVVARQSMPSGHVIKASDVKLVPRRIYRLSDTGMSDVNAVIGQETARPIGINQVVMPSMIRKLRLVKRRDHVEVLSRVGNVVIMMQGIAQGEGGYGDMITVYNERTRKMLHGRITGADSVLAVGDGNGRGRVSGNGGGKK